MKKIAVSLVAMLFFLSCHKNDVSAPEQENQRSCATDEAVQTKVSTDPGLRQRMSEVELLTRRMIESGEVQRMQGTTIIIPVVVHVLYNTPEENISDAQISSQIDVLNEDFNLRNSDRTQIPALFSG